MIKLRKFVWVALLLLSIGGFAQAQSLNVNPYTLMFNDVALGATKTLTLDISSPVPTSITGFTFTGDPCFNIQFPPTTPYNLPTAMTVLQITVAFSPTILGPVLGNLSIESSSLSPASVVLTGNGIMSGSSMLTLLPDTHDYGNMLIGESSVIPIVMRLSDPWVTAWGNGFVQSVDITGWEDFSITAIQNMTTAQSITFPTTLVPSDVINIYVNFTSTTLGLHSAMIDVLGGDGLHYTAVLQATSTEPSGTIRIVPNSLIVNQSAETIATDHFEIFNDGLGELTFDMDTSALPGWINLSPTAGAIATMGSTVIDVEVDTNGITSGNYSYLVGISNSDPGNDYISYMITVEVTPAPLQADFHATPLTGHPPLVVEFFDDSTGASPIGWAAINSWQWDFENDGIFDAFTPSPVHTYTQPGTYSVRLVVGTAAGTSSQSLRTDYINVTNSAPIVVNPLGPLTISEDTSWGPDYINTVFSDPDTDPITLSAKNSEHLTATVDGVMLTITPAANWFGTETIQLYATDPFGAFASHAVAVTVTPVNDAPILSIPADLYFLCNSVFTFDFGPYIYDPDNSNNQLSIELSNPAGPGLIQYSYTPVNMPNVVGQLVVDFTYSSPTQDIEAESFGISVNDNMGRLIATGTFTMHVIDHFMPQITLDDIYHYAGQTVGFNDATQGNPNYWYWTFGDGNTSTEQHPNHQYLNAGTYDVSLTLGYSTLPQEERQITIPSMIHLVGTAVTETDIPNTWTLQGSPYNLYGAVVINETTTIEIESAVVVNFFDQQPLVVEGAIHANGAQFKPQDDLVSWGGFRFQGSRMREPSQLVGCELVDAILPIDIVDSNPILDNLTITVSDTTQVYNTGTAVKISGNSPCTFSNSEIFNYYGGVLVDSESTGRVTPTLTNIRVRNATNTQRTANAITGITLMSDASLNNIQVENYTDGFYISAGTGRTQSTPTLTNIRVRNATNTQRNALTTGVFITGNTAPQITQLDVSDVDRGLVLDTVTPIMRDTPTLSNIRIRNATNTQRSVTNGMIIKDTPNVIITDAHFDDFATGIYIESAATRIESTPIMTNIRVRNASNTQRNEDTGLVINGSVNVRMEDWEIEDYSYGIRYIMDNALRITSTPTLTNIRVRNATNTQRTLSEGAVFNGLTRLAIDDMLVEDFNKGIEIHAPVNREATTPILTNIRVRNATNTQREENIGIFLGSGVGGSFINSRIEEATIGVFLADGNRTVMEQNKIVNCTTGIRAFGINPLPIRKQTMYITDQYFMENAQLDFCAMQLYGAGPWNVYQNTMMSFKKGVILNEAQMNFHSNILWTNYSPPIPILSNSSTFTATYNDINQPQGMLYPGLGNLNAYPCFALTQPDDYSLLRESPCIDTGNPIMPLEEDGSTADMGAHPYLHRASAVVSPRFSVVGTTVYFNNTSIGHDFPDTQIEWDINDDGWIDSTQRNFSHTFTTPGVYHIRLRMESGALVDEVTHYNHFVVSTMQLLPPQNPELEKDGNDMVITWDPVTTTVEGYPVEVQFYVVFKAKEQEGIYYFCGITPAPVTEFRNVNGASNDKAFYIVVAYTGTREELRQYIDNNQRYLGRGMKLNPE